MTVLVGSLLTVARASLAQPAGKVRRIGLVGSSAIPEDQMAAFRAGLAESGFTVGQNVLVEYRWLGNRLSPLPEIVADFVRSAVDVIVAYGSPATLSAKTATQSVPIVMVRGPGSRRAGDRCKPGPPRRQHHRDLRSHWPGHCQQASGPHQGSRTTGIADRSPVELGLPGHEAAHRRDDPSRRPIEDDGHVVRCERA
jgi:hypothetical protein